MANMRNNQNKNNCKNDNKKKMVSYGVVSLPIHCLKVSCYCKFIFLFACLALFFSPTQQLLALFSEIDRFVDFLHANIQICQGMEYIEINKVRDINIIFSICPFLMYCILNTG